ncbi:hypothetical protein [Streptomyces nogalater]|uniref:Uncharacterized protein n=1 Tax=Streptomyces nogalater TaxID=38314 RepID=A0ABW0WW22_STRNO
MAGQDPTAGETGTGRPYPARTYGWYPGGKDDRTPSTRRWAGRRRPRTPGCR